MSDVLYLYGFVSSPAPAPELPGIDGAPVELIEADGLHAAVSRLPAATYAAAQVEERMADQAWVAECSAAHERVVAWFVDRDGILPAPLLNLYASASALAASAHERAQELRAQFARLGGRREWDLKVTWDREQLTRHAGSVSLVVRALDGEIEAAGPGRRILLERQRAEVVRRELGTAARGIAEQLLREVRSRVDSVVNLPPPRAAEMPVLVTAALLLRREAEEETRVWLRQRTEALERLGFSIEYTGPRAPYCFLESAALAPMKH